jgi:hypothetical protein
MLFLRVFWSEKRNSVLGVLKVGDHVQIKPEWQDDGDHEFERIVIEAPENSHRLLIKTLIPSFKYPPTERIEITKLESFDGNEASGHWQRMSK